MFTALWSLAAIWTVVNLCRLWLIPSAVNRWQQQTGITIGLFSVTWQTDYFNRWLNNNFTQFSGFNHRKVSTWYRFGQRYFKLGVWLTAVSFPVAIYLILNALIQSGTAILSRHYLKNDSKESLASSQYEVTSNNNNGPGLMIVIPGVSVPGTEFLYFIAALAISSVIHEAGHALAAKLHRMQIESVGISLFICLPMAFVVILDEPQENASHGEHEMKRLSNNRPMIFRQLEIVSAGLINNAVLCLLTVLIAFYLNPLHLLYGTGYGGLIVTQVHPQSSLSTGPNALQPGEVITSINGRLMNSYEDWTKLLSSMQPTTASVSDDTDHQSGFCVSSSFLAKYSSSILPPCTFETCCDDDHNASGKNLCFLLNTVHQQTTTDAMEPPQDCDLQPLLATSNLQQYVANFLKQGSFQSVAPPASADHQQHHLSGEVINRYNSYFALRHRKACLPVRPVTEAATQLCTSSADCVPTYFGDSVCLQALHRTVPTVRLLVIALESRHSTMNILFWGPPAELLQAVKVSPLKPRLSFLPLTLPQQLDVFMRYLFSMSFSMILFNLIPLRPFDGYQLLQLSSLYFLRGSERTRQKVLSIAHLSACLLALLCAIAGLMQLSQRLYQ